jgi:hypothetical protein
MAAKRGSRSRPKRAKRTTNRRAAPRRKIARPARASAARGRGGRKWSAKVMERSDAMDLESGVFKKRSARQVALSLKRSAERSSRRKAPPFRSAMSMLNFEINRGGKNLSPERRRVLNQAKNELRKAYGRPTS